MRRGMMSQVLEPEARERRASTSFGPKMRNIDLPFSSQSLGYLSHGLHWRVKSKTCSCEWLERGRLGTRCRTRS